MPVPANSPIYGLVEVTLGNCLKYATVCNQFHLLDFWSVQLHLFDVTNSEPKLQLFLSFVRFL